MVHTLHHSKYNTVEAGGIAPDCERFSDVTKYLENEDIILRCRNKEIRPRTNLLGKDLSNGTLFPCCQ